MARFMDNKKHTEINCDGKYFRHVVAWDGHNQCWRPVPLYTIEIGKPVFLMLPDGNVVRTSSVQEWSEYGCEGRIYTRNSAYYKE